MPKPGIFLLCFKVPRSPLQGNTAENSKGAGHTNDPGAGKQAAPGEVKRRPTDAADQREVSCGGLMAAPDTRRGELKLGSFSVLLTKMEQDPTAGSRNETNSAVQEGAAVSWQWERLDVGTIHWGGGGLYNEVRDLPER